MEKRGDNIDGQFEGHDIVDDYMNMNKEWNSDHSENLVDICRDLFIAGTDTTSATLSFAILHMLREKFHDFPHFIWLSFFLTLLLSNLILNN